MNKDYLAIIFNAATGQAARSASGHSDQTSKSQIDDVEPISQSHNPSPLREESSTSHCQSENDIAEWVALAGGDKMLEIWFSWAKTPSHDAFHKLFNGRCMLRRHLALMFKINPDTNEIYITRKVFKYILDNYRCVKSFLSSVIEQGNYKFYATYSMEDSPHDSLHGYARALTMNRVKKIEGHYFLPPTIKHFLNNGFYDQTLHKWFSVYPLLKGILCVV